MSMFQRTVAWAWWTGYLGALAAVALMSLLIGLVLGRIHVANISMLYLIVVFATAIAFGSGPAIVASVAAFLTFDWFFVDPLYSITVSDPAEWVALLLFLLTAIITGQLTAAVRRRALQAEQREREAAVLYDVVRLMGNTDLVTALGAVAERLRMELSLSAATIELIDGERITARVEAGEPGALRLADHASTASVYLLGEGHPPTGGQRGVPGGWIKVVSTPMRGQSALPTGNRVYVVPVSVRDRRVGTLTLITPVNTARIRAAETRLLSALAVQLGLATERVRLQREATDAEILRRTDELKTALINAVSHDLRTPLASIIASAGSLHQQDVPWTDSDRAEFVEAIEQEAQRLNRIVGNLLDLSRVEAGSLRPEMGWYDLGALIDDVLGRLRATTAGHAVVAKIPDDLPPVLLDYVEIDQVLSNLIENATKYAPPGTPIELTVDRTEDHLVIDVLDRGPGIPPSALPRLFEPFFRVDGLGPRPHGTGVGLTVARGLIGAHGGRIWAENRPGGGARFAFTLPLAAPEIAAPRAKARAGPPAA